MSPCLCLYGPDHLSARSLSCGIVVNVLSRSRFRRRGFVPDCGCKITTVFAPMQIFLCSKAYFLNFSLITYIGITKSTNVKIYFIVLTIELLTAFRCYSKTVLSRTFFKIDLQNPVFHSKYPKNIHRYLHYFAR